MECYLQDIGKVLQQAVKDATTPLLGQLSALQEDNQRLQSDLEQCKTALAHRSQQCLELMETLQRKTEEWRRLKEKIRQVKSLRQLASESDVPNSGYTHAPSSPMDSASIVDLTSECENEHEPWNDKEKENKDHGGMSFEEANRSVSLAPVPKKLQLAESLCETQLLTGGANDRIPQWDTDNTQLDLLIDMYDNNPPAAATDMPLETSSNLASFNARAHSVSSITTKRKGHKRGCPCCEKYYQATRNVSRQDILNAAADPYTRETGASTPPGFWDVNFTPRP